MHRCILSDCRGETTTLFARPYTCCPSTHYNLSKKKREKDFGVSTSFEVVIPAGQVLPSSVETTGARESVSRGCGDAVTAAASGRGVRQGEGRMGMSPGRRRPWVPRPASGLPVEHA